MVLKGQDQFYQESIRSPSCCLEMSLSALAINSSKTNAFVNNDGAVANSSIDEINKGSFVQYELWQNRILNAARLQPESKREPCRLIPLHQGRSSHLGRLSGCLMLWRLENDSGRDGRYASIPSSPSS